LGDINILSPLICFRFLILLISLPLQHNLKPQKQTIHLMKVTVVGAGAVGATCADNIARKELCSELVLLDIKEGISEGKSLDLFQTSSLLGFDTRITGSTNDYTKTANSDVVVITSGIPRKPGMTREELIGTNAGIVKGVTENILKYSPNAIIIVISNPMDTMTYLALKSSGIPKNRIIGMGGILDSARFKCYLSLATGASTNDIHGVVIGGHGDTTMIPLTRLATINGMPVSYKLDEAALQKVAADTMVGGATLTGLLGTSAWYAPGAAGAALVEAIVRDEKKVMPCCVYLEGEYGQKDICLGVPVVIGRNGWEEIVDYKLTESEQAAFNKSAEAVRSMNSVLGTVTA
jgi:malate dehydrogenase